MLLSLSGLQTVPVPDTRSYGRRRSSFVVISRRVIGHSPEVILGLQRRGQISLEESQIAIGISTPSGGDDLSLVVGRFVVHGRGGGGRGSSAGGWVGHGPEVSLQPHQFLGLTCNNGNSPQLSNELLLHRKVHKA